jgi:hypothetical protein
VELNTIEVGTGHIEGNMLVAINTIYY